MSSIVVQGGTYTHDVGEVEYSYTVEGVLNDQGNTVTHKVTVAMQGELYGTDTNELSYKITSLSSAYRKHITQWRLLRDGSPLPQSILATQTIDGIRVVSGPTFPSNKGGVYLTHIPYSIVIEWEQLEVDQYRALRSFTETIQFSGGGPRYGHIETAVDFPVKQLLRQKTIYRATQSGSAMGMFVEPKIPDPLWPADLVEENPARTLGSGRWSGVGVVPLRRDIPVTWQYNFESALPMFGIPNAWGVTK